MKPANITKNQYWLPDLFTNLHKLLGTEVALDIYLATIKEIVDIVPVAALQAKCVEHKVELQVIIDTLAEFLSSTPVSLKVAAAFTDGTDVIYAIRSCLQQSSTVAVLMQCHAAIIYSIKTDSMAIFYPNNIRPFLLQTLSTHERMEYDLQKFTC